MFGYITIVMDLDTSLQNALRLFESGESDSCAKICRDVLVADSRHPQALSLLGLSYHRNGETATALEYFAQALEVSPDDPSICYNYGVILLEADRPADACDVLLPLVSRYPNIPESQFLLGNALARTGRHEDAVAHYQQATVLRPDYLDAWYNLGLAFKALERYSDSAEIFQQALAVEPNHSPSLFQLSLVRYSQGSSQLAIDDLRQLLSINPEDGLVAMNLGILLQETDQAEEAILWLEKAAGLLPQNSEVCNSLGLAYYQCGRLSDAAAAFRNALALNPNSPEAFSNLGNVLFDEHHYEEAISQYEKALGLNQQMFKAWYNLGKCYHQLLEVDKGIAMYRQAIALEPDLAEAHWNLSHLLLLIGQYQEGFNEYLWRWRRKAAPPNAIPKPEWHGEFVPTHTLLVHAEQGMGDAIQFVRYLPLVRQRVGKLYLACAPPLVSLFQSLPGVDAILTQENMAAIYHVFDQQVPLLNLPSIFSPPENAIPCDVPYLAPDQKRLKEFAPLFAQAADHLKVGLVWRGNPAHLNDANRSCQLAEFASLFHRSNTTFYSLQLSSDEESPGLINLSSHLETFADTAALMSHLDLIISVDTSTAHLAGALARPVWLLLPYVPEWRWGLTGESTPWYPTMRIFRQPHRGDWSTVMNLVRSALDELHS